MLNLASQADADPASHLGAAAALTTYGVEVRYPGDLPEPSLAETRGGVALARMVCDAVAGRVVDH